MAIKIIGNTSGNISEVDSNNNLRVITPGNSATGVPFGGGAAAAPAIYSESDAGTITGSRLTLSPETDADFRLRIANEVVLDDEVFNTTTQNQNKYGQLTTTFTTAYTANGLNSNSGAGVASGSGFNINSYTYFPLLGQGTITNTSIKMSFSAACPTNTTAEWGLAVRALANPYTASDGVYFSLTSGGLNGVVNYNGNTSTVSLSAFTITANRVYDFNIVINRASVLFYIDNVLYGTVNKAVGDEGVALLSSLPVSVRHVIVASNASGAFNLLIRSYCVSLSGPLLNKDVANGYMSTSNYSLPAAGYGVTNTNYTNNFTPTAAVPSNTALTANLIAGLSGTCYETDTLAVNTDGILLSQQNGVLNSVAYTQRRIRITGIKIDSFIQGALTSGGYNAVWVLNFGHTAVSLATTDTTNAKGPRKLIIGSNSVASGAAALTQLTTISADFSSSPVFVNPGEFVAVSKKKVGTAPSGGTIAHTIQLFYSWE